jgi:hypothetical protein
MEMFPGPFRHLASDVVNDLVTAFLVALAASSPPAFWTVSGMPSETAACFHQEAIQYCNETVEPFSAHRRSKSKKDEGDEETRRAHGNKKGGSEPLSI